MRYSDSELFDITKEQWDDVLDDDITPRYFMHWCIGRLKYLIEQSTKQEDWMTDGTDHLRNYRLKSIRFYERKLGL